MSRRASAKSLHKDRKHHLWESQVSQEGTQPSHSDKIRRSAHRQVFLITYL